jgi:hypothetical protein
MMIFVAVALVALTLVALFIVWLLGQLLTHASEITFMLRYIKGHYESRSEWAHFNQEIKNDLKVWAHAEAKKIKDREALGRSQGWQG